MLFCFGIRSAAMFTEPAIAEIDEVVGLAHKRQRSENRDQRSDTRGQRSKLKSLKLSIDAGRLSLTSDL
jgi:hypothetical protein